MYSIRIGWPAERGAGTKWARYLYCQQLGAGLSRRGDGEEQSHDGSDDREGQDQQCQRDDEVCKDVWTRITVRSLQHERTKDQLLTFN